MRPFSIGHSLLLVREDNPLYEGKDASPRALAEAALLCSQTWTESQRMPFDPLIGFKMWLWRRRCRKANLGLELQTFLEYRDSGSLELPISDTPRPTSQSRTQGRPPGSPFLLRLQQFLMLKCGLGEIAAWDYPLGLAQMRWAAYWEEQDALDIYNHIDAEIDRSHAEHVAAMEAKQRRDDPCQAC
jgi:hypothetical protein